MDIETLYQYLSAYIDRELSDELLLEIEEFICDNEECLEIINSLRATVELCNKLESEREVPLDIHIRFRRTIRLELEKYESETEESDHV